MNATLQVLVYGLLAGLSPGALLATLAVLSTRRARANGSAFAAGFVLGQSVGLVIPLAVGSVAIPSGGENNNTVAGMLELLVGLALLEAARRARKPRKKARAPGKSRADAVLRRLEGVNPRTAFSLGIPVGIGIKRLMITILAASTIALAADSKGQEAALSVLYVLVASVLVWAPVGAYLVAGARADSLVADSKTWLSDNDRKVTFVTSLVLGLFFLGAGIAQLT
jgi:hypothetical protein